MHESQAEAAEKRLAAADDFDREQRMWRLERKLNGARAPRLDGLEHVGWLYESNATDINTSRFIGHVPKARLDELRSAGFATRPIYAGPRHAGTEPLDGDGVLPSSSDQPKEQK